MMKIATKEAASMPPITVLPITCREIEPAPEPMAVNPYLMGMGMGPMSSQMSSPTIPMSAGMASFSPDSSDDDGF